MAGTFWNGEAIYQDEDAHWTRKRAYQAAVVWIALNDEPEDMDPESVAMTISVILIADTFGRNQWNVGEDVVAYRETGKLP